MIGILGDTGAGKSSLLNSLLYEHDVLPTSGVRACTAAPIEIHYKSGLSTTFEVHITFLSKEDWEKEADTLLDDLRDEHGRLKARMKRPRGETAKIAFDKLMSVYGCIKERHLLKDKDCFITKRLGETHRYTADTAEGIRSKTEQFASSRTTVNDHFKVVSSSSVGRYWPLVLYVRLRGPFPLLRSCEGVLVDLPGLSDANAARNKVVDGYIQKCSGFLIAAPITRAVDNKTAKNLLGQQFRQQMLLVS